MALQRPQLAGWDTVHYVSRQSMVSGGTMYCILAAPFPYYLIVPGGELLYLY